MFLVFFILFLYVGGVSFKRFFAIARQHGLVFSYPFAGSVETVRYEMGQWLLGYDGALIGSSRSILVGSELAMTDKRDKSASVNSA